MPSITRRCATCGRFRGYEDTDSYCIACGNDSLESACQCGRSFDYVSDDERDTVHCPRCGRRLTGRAEDFSG